MDFRLGDKVRIINPNNEDFGLEGSIEGVRINGQGITEYQVMKIEGLSYRYRWAREYEIEVMNNPVSAEIKIDENGFRLGKNLFEFNKEGIQIKPFKDYGDDAADAIKYCVEYKEEKEEGGKDNMKILNIYEDRKSLEIAKKYKEEIEKTKSEDAFESLRLNTEKQVKALYKNEFNKEFSGIILFESDCEARLLTKETKDKLAEIETNKKIELSELDGFLEEVRAQLELAKDYETQMKILKRYDIIGKDGKINA